MRISVAVLWILGSCFGELSEESMSATRTFARAAILSLNCNLKFRCIIINSSINDLIIALSFRNQFIKWFIESINSKIKCNRRNRAQAIAPCKEEVKKMSNRRKPPSESDWKLKGKVRKTSLSVKVADARKPLTGKQDENGRKEINFSRENNVLRINCCWINQKSLGVLSKQLRNRESRVDFLGLLGENNKSLCVKNRIYEILGYFWGFVRNWQYVMFLQNMSTTFLHKSDFKIKKTVYRVSGYCWIFVRKWIQ